MLYQGKRAIAVAPLIDDYLPGSNIHHEVVLRGHGQLSRPRVPRVASIARPAHLARPTRSTIEGVIEGRQQHSRKLPSMVSGLGASSFEALSSLGQVPETTRDPPQEAPGLQHGLARDTAGKPRGDAGACADLDRSFLAEIDEVHNGLIVRSGGECGLGASIPHGGLTCGALRDIGAAPQLHIPLPF